MCCKGNDCQCGNCGCQGHSCECGESTRFERRFFSREEQIAELEQYLQSLQLEIKAVEERLAELKAA
jgi:hypothetical protein